MQLTNPSPDVKPLSESPLTSGNLGVTLRNLWDWITWVQSDDAVRRMFNRGFAVVLAFLFLINAISIPIYIATGEGVTPFVLLTLGLFLVMWWLNRRGTPYGIALMVIWSTAVILLASSPAEYVGRTTPMPLRFIFPMVFACLFLGARAGIWSLLLFISALGLQLLSSTLPHDVSLRFVLIALLNLGSITALMMVGASIFTRTLRAWADANATLRKANEEIKARVEEQKRAEEALAAEHNRLRTLIASLPHRILYKDTEARFRLINTTHAHDLGIATPEEAIGKSDFDFFPQEIAVQYYADDMAVLQSGQPLVNREEITLDAHGNQRWLLTNKYPLHDDAGRVNGLIAVAIDITDRKQAERQGIELAVAKERAELLKEFLNTLSHDLKTPLSVIHTSLYLLKKSTDPEQRARKLEQIGAQANQLEKLIQDILAMSRLDTAPELVFKPLDLNPMIEAIDRQVQCIAEEHSLTLRLDLGAAIPRVLVSEEDMQRAFMNLIENALHYTPPEGTITVRTFRQGDEVIVEIADTGIGIDEADLARIFEHFFRADRARATDVAGTGLGLAIVKKTVEMHGGSIEVESVPGAGSTFRVRLPVSAEQSESSGERDER